MKHLSKSVMAVTGADVIEVISSDFAKMLICYNIAKHLTLTIEEKRSHNQPDHICANLL
jgi:hypothetical protein